MLPLLQRPRELLAKKPRAVDGAKALFFATGGLISLFLVPLEGSERPRDALAVVLVVAAASTAFWSRTKPLVALPICTALVITYWVLDYPGGFDPVMWYMFFAAARHGGHDRTRVWRVIGASLAATVSIAIVGVLVPTEDLPLGAVFGIAAFHSIAPVIGEALYQRSKYVSELEDRAAMLEADIETKATLAAVEERTRIAREMHDVIAHGMSTIVVQSQAGQSVVDHDPALAREILKTIEEIGRDSVDDVRRMLGVLRSDDTDAEFAPQPTFADLQVLQDHAEDAGVELAVTRTGEPRPLPPGLELTGYRLVQEALTNVIKHAGRPVRVDAEIAYAPHSIEIAIIDDGLGAAASADTAGTGHGLLGMRERVEIYDGELRSGPRPGGGFEVRAILPIPVAASR